jgi:putative MFS transporter
VFLNAASQFLFVAGELYSAVLMWVDDPQLKGLHWQWLLLLGVIPAIVLGSFAVFYLIESPKYFANRGQIAEAQNVLEAVRRSNGCSSDVSVELEEAAVPQAHADQGYLGQMKIVFGPRLRFTTFVICVSVFTLNFVSWGSFYAFPQVLPALKLHISPAANICFGVLIEIPGFVLGLWVANRTARKPATLCYLVATILSVATFLYGTGVDFTLASTGRQSPWAVQAGFIGIKLFINLGFIAVYLYATEVYPTVARTTGSAICLAMGRLGAMACPLVYEELRRRTGTFHAFFVLIACLAGLNGTLVCCLSIETAGKGLSDSLELDPLIVTSTDKSV